MAENRKFNTVEDMVKSVVASPHYADTRWMLVASSHQEYIDPEAGATWEEARTALPYISRCEPGYEAREAARAALFAQQPAVQNVVKWVLAEKSSSRFALNIDLSTELGEALDGIWAKTEAYPGESNPSRRVKPLGIPTMLKRLGAKGVDAKIKAAQAEAIVDRDRNRRNYVRHEARDLASKLAKLVADHPEIEFPDSLAGMVNLVDEEG